MDQSENQQNPSQPLEIPSSSRSIHFNKKIIYVLITLVILIPLSVFFLMKTALKKEDTVASVNNTPVYKTFLDKELELYPAEQTPEVKKMLEQKVIDDQITLEGAKKEGLIKDYDNNPSMTSQEYLARTKLVQDTKKKIDENGNSISGTKIMLWMYNNGTVGKMGLAKAKEIAYAKIKPLYDKVKKGDITIEQAGAEIKKDTSLKDIDPVWDDNAISTFRYYKNKRGTFWKEFDEILWKTKEGDITPLYLGRGRDKHNIMSDELYIFAKVDKKTSNKTYTNYADWLTQQKKNGKITFIEQFPFSVHQAFAQEADSSAGSNNSDNNGSNSGGGGGDDNGCNSASPWGCGDGHGWSEWSVRVVSQTGAPVANARVRYTNGCTNEEFNSGSGTFGFGPSTGYGCGCNPHTFTVYQPASQPAKSSYVPKAYAADKGTSTEPSCGTKTKKIQNGDFEISETVTCTITPPTPTPTPKLACGKDCTKPSDCTGAFDGCTSCIADATTGKKTCQAPACGTSCTKNDECAGSKEGCSVCVADKTGKKTCTAPACGVSCEKNDECAGAKDGCIACLKDSSGKKVCAAPACGIQCSNQNDCAAIKDGCTVCAPNDKGVDVCQAKNQAADTDVCKCDGMDFARADGNSETFFPGDTVNFISYAKIMGADTKTANLESVTFSLYSGTQKDANTATRIAQSAPVTPQIISTTADLIRYKAVWQHTMPKSITGGALFRLQATLKCGKKAGVKGAATSKTVLADSDTVSPTLDSQQQHATTFSPGAMISEKSCTFIKFFFN